MTAGGKVTKRVLDIAVSLILLVGLSPLFLIIALSIRIGTPGPILFRQSRVGRNCVPFSMYKFRTMVEDAASQGGFRTNPGDPRVTGIGRILRKASLDELPQLLNVLRGDMSLVGPRPDVPQQESDYVKEDWVLRHSVRPGITGLAQASSRSTATPALRCKYDLEYVRSYTLLGDLRILLRTFKQVFSKGGY